MRGQLLSGIYLFIEWVNLTSGPQDRGGGECRGVPAREAVAHKTALWGVVAALGAYLIWGTSTILYKWLDHVPASEIIAHRIVWSILFAGLYLLWRGRMGEVRAALGSRKTALTLLLTSILISLNWGVFVWAIARERTVEAAFGYFILPLLSVAIAYVLLGEKLNRAQMIAVGLAAIAVSAQMLAIDVFPWAGLSLAVLFAFYGFIRKKLDVGASPGMFIEVALLGLPAAAYIAYREYIGAGQFLSDGRTAALLFFTGPVTAIPLILYAEAVRRLRMVTVGLIFYINPTVQFLIGAVIFAEPVSGFRLATFALIWIALGIFAMDALRAEERRAPLI